MTMQQPLMKVEGRMVGVRTRGTAFLSCFSNDFSEPLLFVIITS